LLVLAAVFEAKRRFRWGRKFRADSPPICLVSHDGHRHGAQLLLLNIAFIFARVFGLSLHIVLLGPGRLSGEFRQFGRVYKLANQTGQAADHLAALLAHSGVKSALCSSTASGLFLGPLVKAGIRCVALVHELPKLIAQRDLGAHAAAISQHAAVSVFPSQTVLDQFPADVSSSAIIRPQGLAKRRGPPDLARRLKARTLLNEKHAIPLDAPLVINVGYGDYRKGIDVFVDVAKRLLPHTEAHFLWLGDVDPDLAPAIIQAMRQGNAIDRIHLAPFCADTAPYYDGADVFALTSREDPFPSVLLEALDVALPIVAFEGAGGFDALFADQSGALSKDGAPAFADTLLKTLKTPSTGSLKRQERRATGLYDPSMRAYAYDLAKHLHVGVPRVSVLVPSFNYARYLRGRLSSILKQTAPIYEIIVLDDQSTDTSVDVARAALSRCDLDWRVIEGEKKSTTVFEQWRRGVEIARGDLIWIAEADDMSDPQFLEHLIAPFKAPTIVMSFCQSRQINEAGKLIEGDYLDYVADIGASRWKRPYTHRGVDEISNALAVKNTIPNVSACVFRTDALRNTMDAHFDMIAQFKVAGDWLTYVRLLGSGDIAYTPKALNLHRRHASSVTVSALSEVEALREIEAIQRIVREEHEISAETLKIAAAYAAKLRREFGLE